MGSPQTDAGGSGRSPVKIMLKSMTGFASLTHDDEQVNLTVTVRSVNHRYLDAHVRVPAAFAELEQGLRGLVQEHVARGRVELTVTAQLKIDAPVELDLNERLAEALVNAAEQARLRGWIESGLTAGELLRFPQAVTVRELPADREAWQAVCTRVSDTVGEALGDLDRMRRREGEFLHTDLAERAAAVGALVDRIVADAATGADALRERLAARIEDLGGTVQAEPELVAQEIVKWAARSDIHEEVARLRGHLEHLAELAEGSAPCGRKLDFLVQEMNREINTIGSKAEGRETGALVVAAKAEVERLREQIQNVE